MIPVTLAGRFVLAGWLLFLSSSFVASGSSGCTNFDGAVIAGRVSFSALVEASGIAASRRNYTVLWTHNDGSQGKIYALTTNAIRLATFDLTQNVEDLEDVAVGPGPTNGVSYLYVGDIGGSSSPGDVRPDVKLLRIPEPIVELEWSNNPPALDFNDVKSFTLCYPDGSYDAETLMVDPLTADVWIATKEVDTTRFYRANLNSATNGQTITLEFVIAVSFSVASAGDISPDGTMIILRREDMAQLWERRDGESIGVALSRAARVVPVVGPPTEPNGEGIAFLADNLGYVTISEGDRPRIYLFRATCPRGPQFMILPQDQTVMAGGSAQFRVAAAGIPAPTYDWRHNGEVISNQLGNTLVVSNVTPASAGTYEVTASNEIGSVSVSATLTVLTRPDIRITEVMSSESSGSGVPTADWWELTSFAAQPVSLQGWRFNDNGGGLTDPFTITSALVIAPGESIVFVDSLSTAQFTNWWGSTNLPPNLKVVSYSGNGLSLGATGDGIRLWDNITTNANDTVARVDFGTATAGVSFTYDPVTQVFGGLSQPGVNGAFRAAAANDIGSPGRVRALIVAPSLTGLISNDVFRVEFMTIPAGRYSLESRQDFAESSWMPTGDTLFATNASIAVFAKPRAADNRFYRVVAE